MVFLLLEVQSIWPSTGKRFGFDLQNSSIHYGLDAFISRIQNDWFAELREDLQIEGQGKRGTFIPHPIF